MVVDLLLRNDSGAVKLTAGDRDLIHRMLNSSDDAAALTLWTRYGGEAEFAKRFPSYGMTDMRFTDQHPHHWGWIVNSVGFVGPHERYTLALMNNTKVIQNGYETGQETTTKISEILFTGYFGD
ncbi:serine hydrolase [Amycolatopsis thailandensis]|uniref:serine hydrolase n=1 Tax=Amycolatopsis thailandensis TaxID=589330 RepID=UPI001FC9C908|nr:serine hydrolase [Amycolatopsis thailandensis]